MFKGWGPREKEEGIRQEASKHSSFVFVLDSEQQAQLWVAALQDYTMSEDALPAGAADPSR